MSIAPSFALHSDIPASDATLTQRATLTSWKAIASELDRSVRTVQRWEHELGLPVRRLKKGRPAPVFALKDELQNWLRRYGNLSTRDPNTVLLQSIADLFSNKNSDSNKDCSRCGSPKKHLKVVFWVDAMNRSVSLPFCPSCSGDSLQGSPLIEKALRHILNFPARRAA